MGWAFGARSVWVLRADVTSTCSSWRGCLWPASCGFVGRSRGRWARVVSVKVDADDADEGVQRLAGVKTDLKSRHQEEGDGELGDAALFVSVPWLEALFDFGRRQICIAADRLAGCFGITCDQRDALAAFAPDASLSSDKSDLHGVFIAANTQPGESREGSVDIGSIAGAYVQPPDVDKVGGALLQVA